MKKRYVPIVLLSSVFFLSACTLFGSGSAGKESSAPASAHSSEEAGSASSKIAVSSSESSSEEISSSSSSSPISSSEPESSAPVVLTEVPDLDAWKTAFDWGYTNVFQEDLHQELAVDLSSRIVNRKTKIVARAGGDKQVDYFDDYDELAGRYIYLIDHALNQDAGSAHRALYKKDYDGREYLDSYDNVSAEMKGEINQSTILYWETVLHLSLTNFELVLPTLTYSATEKAFVSGLFKTTGYTAFDATLTPVSALPSEWRTENGDYVRYTFSCTQEVISGWPREDLIRTRILWAATTVYSSQHFTQATSPHIEVSTSKRTYTNLPAEELDYPKTLDYAHEVRAHPSRFNSLCSIFQSSLVPSANAILDFDVVHTITDDTPGQEKNWVGKDTHRFMGNFDYWSHREEDKIAAPGTETGKDVYTYYGPAKVFTSTAIAPASYANGPYVDAVRAKAEGDGEHNVVADFGDGITQPMMYYFAIDVFHDETSDNPILTPWFTVDDPNAFYPFNSEDINGELKREKAETDTSYYRYGLYAQTPGSPNEKCRVEVLRFPSGSDSTYRSVYEMTFRLDDGRINYPVSDPLFESFILENK